MREYRRTKTSKTSWFSGKPTKVKIALRNGLWKTVGSRTPEKYHLTLFDAINWVSSVDGK